MNRWNGLAVLIIVAAGILGYVVARGGMREAAGQGMVSESGNTIVVVAQERNARIPLILVDTREQTICIYRYDFNANSLEFSVARSYQWDKKLERYGHIKGASPDDIRKIVTK